MKALSDQVTERLQKLTQRHGMKARLAKELNTVPSAITPYTNGDREVTLRMLEALSRISGVPVSEIVATPGSTLCELTPEEATILKRLRQWPLELQQALALLLSDDPKRVRSKSRS